MLSSTLTVSNANSNNYTVINTSIKRPTFYYLGRRGWVGLCCHSGCRARCRQRVSGLRRVSWHDDADGGAQRLGPGDARGVPRLRHRRRRLRGEQRAALRAAQRRQPDDGSGTRRADRRGGREPRRAHHVRR